jgi:hypothetical protein
MTKFHITLPGGVVIEIYAKGRGGAITAAINQHYGTAPMKVIFLKYIPGGVVYEVWRKGKPALEVTITQ